MATLKDIADLVGVSISTVSRVLNNDKSRSVSDLTRQKILDVAQELEYRPNTWAQKLVKGNQNLSLSGSELLSNSWTIGCIITVPYAQFSYPYFSEIIKGIENTLEERECSLAFVHSIDELRDPEIFKNLIIEEKLDGIIVVGSIETDLYTNIRENIKNVVGIDVTSVSIPTVNIDRQHASQSAVEHLIAQGHKKIGFIGGLGLSGDIYKEKRFKGYKYALIESGLEIREEWIINADWQIEKSYNLMNKFIVEHQDDLPTAMFVASDVMAISAMRAASENKLRIPDDMAFFGFDNIDISKYTVPSLSTIHVPKVEVGVTAAKLLLDYIEGRFEMPMKVILPYKMIIRQSSGKGEL